MHCVIFHIVSGVCVSCFVDFPSALHRLICNVSQQNRGAVRACILGAPYLHVDDNIVLQCLSCKTLGTRLKWF